MKLDRYDKQMLEREKEIGNAYRFMHPFIQINKTDQRSTVALTVLIDWT